MSEFCPSRVYDYDPLLAEDNMPKPLKTFIYGESWNAYILPKCEWCKGRGKILIPCPARHHGHHINVLCGRCEGRGRTQPKPESHSLQCNRWRGAIYWDDLPCTCQSLNVTERDAETAT